MLLACYDKWNPVQLNFSAILSSIPHIDIVGCRCYNGLGSFYIIVLYIPPSVPIGDYIHFMELLSDYVCLLRNVVIIGDFNCPALYYNLTNDSKSRSIYDLLNCCALTQYNCVVNNMKRVLDLVISNVNCVVCHSLESMVSEDLFHPALSITLCFNKTYVPKFSTALGENYNFRKGNFIGLYNAIGAVNWSFLYNYSDVDFAFKAFYDTVFSCIDNFVPKITSKHPRSQASFPTWFTHDTRNLIRIKNRYRDKYKNTKSNIYYNLFCYYRSLSKRRMTSDYKEYVTLTENAVSGNPKKFWEFVQNLNHKTRVPGVMTLDNVEYSSPQTIVNAFASYFSSLLIPSEPNYSCESDTVMDNYYPTFNIVEFDESDVLIALTRSKNSFTSGSDGLPEFFVKDCASVLAKPLHFLFNLILRKSHFPDMWKMAFVTPLLKKGSPSDISNYRGISILPSPAKAFETLLYHKIYYNIKQYISTNQHGFVKERSTVTNLCSFTHYLTNAVDSRLQVDAIFLDFRRAFDTLDHYVLLSKLQKYGFSPVLLKLFESYLVNRKQCVRYRNFISDSYEITSGVPQGSNLGPLLFLLFINDLPRVTTCEVLMFADDVKVFDIIKSVDDCQHLQNNLELIVRWSEKNRLDLNINKCTVMSFHKKNFPIQFMYNIKGIFLGNVANFKDLGVTFDTELTFSIHIDHIVSDALKMFGFICRNTKRFSSLTAVVVLFKTLVVSKLEYAVLVWSPYYKLQSQQIEAVQRKFLKLLYLRCEGVYPERGYDYNLLLTKFNFVSLNYRRCLISLKFLYNLLNNHIDCPRLLQEVYFYVPRLNSRQSDTFYNLGCRTNLGKKSPIYVMCSTFNSVASLCDIHSDRFSYISECFRQNFLSKHND